MGPISAPTAQRTDFDVGAELRRVGWQCATAQRRLVHLAADFADGDIWLLGGAPTAAHWIADALDLEVCTAREWIRVGRCLRELRAIDSAFAARELSYSKVRHLTRVATTEHESELVEIARRTSAGRLGIALARWRADHESDDETERRHRRDRGLAWRTDVDGMVVGSFRLPPAAAAVLIAAVDALVMTSGSAATPGGNDASAAPPRSPTVSEGAMARPWPTLSQQRADALVQIVAGGGSRVTTEVVLHVRGDGCSLDDGTPVAGSVVERIAPDAFVSLLIHDADGRPIDASGRQRHPSRRQRRVVRERDGVCVDCGSSELLQYDHVPDFERSRRTLVDELELRCAPCHHRRHASAGTREAVAARSTPNEGLR